MTTLVSTATTVAERLAETRRMAGLTTREMGALIGATHTTISNWEHGKGEPTVSQFARWAQATKQPVETMLDGLDLLSQHSVRPKGLEPLTF